MTDEELIDALSRRGIVGATPPAELLGALDGIGRAGCTALVKIDGERSRDVYTVLISGGPLKDRFFRRDGGELVPLLREAIAWFLANT